MGRYVLVSLWIAIGFMEAYADRASEDYRFPWGPVAVDRCPVRLGILEQGGSYQDTLRIFNPTADTLMLEMTANGLLKIQAEKFRILPHQEEKWAFQLGVPDSCRIGDAWEMLGLTVEEIPIAGGLLPLEAMIIENLPDEGEMKDGVPVLRIADTLCQLGEVERNKLQEIEIKLENQGQEELFIRQIESSCGCVQPVLFSRRIAEGDSVILKLSVYPEGGEGESVERQIRIYCNAPESPVVLIRIIYQIKSN